MAFGEYQEGRGMYEDYLEPAQGNAGAILSAGILAAMLYTPLGGKIMRGVGATGKAAWKGAKWASPRAGKAALRGAKRFAFDVKGKSGKVLKKSILKNTVIGTGTAMSYLSKPVAWASRNPKAVYGMALGSSVLLGGAKGLSARQPYGETFTEDVMFDKSTRRGLPADHNGATGDLTLALHNRR